MKNAIKAEIINVGRLVLKPREICIEDYMIDDAIDDMNSDDVLWELYIEVDGVNIYVQKEISANDISVIAKQCCGVFYSGVSHGISLNNK